MSEDNATTAAGLTDEGRPSARSAESTVDKLACARARLEPDARNWINETFGHHPPSTPEDLYSEGAVIDAFCAGHVNAQTGAEVIVQMSAALFRGYQRSHEAKLDRLDALPAPQSDRAMIALMLEHGAVTEKIDRNRVMADRLEEWLADRREPPAVDGGWKRSGSGTESSNVRPVSVAPLMDPAVVEGLLASAGVIEAAAAEVDQVTGTADLVSIRLATGDPRFDPDKPLTVNGYLFHPAPRN